MFGARRFGKAVVSGLALLPLAVASTAHAEILEVGPGKAYAAPCEAIAAAATGDIIEVDAAGSYDGDVCGWSTDGLTIRGVGGLAHIDAAGQNAQGKGIWVIAGDDTVIENIELSGATVQDQNGAGIRQEGKNLTVRGCYFHDNEDGILAGSDPNSEILVEYSHFENNGYGDGFSHNFYINHVKRFTLQYSYSHRAVIGNLAKSRAAENHILYNRLSAEDGTSSWELDLPNGGLSYVIGNIIQQGDSSPNGSLIGYQMEGEHPDNPSHELFVVNNTFVNDRSNGGTFVNVGGSVTTPAVIRNNIFMGAGTLTSQGNAILEGNFEGDPMFVDKVGFDLQLTAGSPAENAGVEPGMGAGMSLEPTSHYVHPADGEGRVRVGNIDVGAFELGGGVVGGGSGTGGNGSGGGTGTGASSSGGAGSGTGGGGVDGGAGTGANGGSNLDEDGDDGCGCRVPGESGRSPGGAALLVGMMLAGVLARRRR